MSRNTKQLALHGGAPVRKSVLPYGHQDIRDEDLESVLAVLRSDWLTTGPKVAEFEEAFAAAVGARFGIAVNSGTAALHTACFAAGLAPGDEAITTPLTFCATANAVLYEGARPIFADVEDQTLNLDPNAIEEHLTPRTRALMPVDYAGHPADLTRIRALAEERGLRVIEDASHALGATLDGSRVGGLSHLTTFSFHPVKHVTTGEGGMVTTDDPELADRARRFRSLGIASDPSERQRVGTWFYEMTDLGMNYRLPDLACALGLSQLRRLPENLARRRAIAARYTRELADLPGLRLPATRTGADPAWHLYPVRVDPEVLGTDRGEIFRALQSEGLGVNVHYIPVHLHPYYRKRFGTSPGDFPVAEAAYDRLLSLPLFHAMTDADTGDVVNAVRKVFAHYAGSA